MCLLGMHETPQLVELACADMQIVPEIQHDSATVARHPMPPGTDRVLVHVDDSRGRVQRMAFRQRAHRGLKNRWISIQAVIRCTITQDPTPFARFTPCSRRPTAGTVLDQISLRKGLPVITAVAVRTVQGFPIPGLAPSCHSVFTRGGTINRKCALSITAVEGHYPIM